MTFTKEDYEGWLSKGMSGHDIGKMLGFSQTGVARRYRKLKKQAQE
ncbi:hypothetical protein KR50_28550 [Jeotgalibacillus campisalis]|uniref:Uncharacterized protein n=2 Tax=Jeotgalibacillus campisalis TaxID=220754 RepID=A0A0C2R7E9_9BACL|nr:hypothetical protein KR50_28550 [Jeotgalibacillus campisalis]